MIAADPSGDIAAFPSWHERNDAAGQVLDSRPQVVGHPVAESYSVQP